MADLGGAFAQVGNMELEALRKEQERRAEEQRQYDLRVQQQREDRASHPSGDPEWELLDEQKDTRLEREGTALLRPPQTVSERLNKDLGPELSPLMYESDNEKSRELRDDRAGRQSRMENMLAHLSGGGGRESGYKQYYTNAPRVSGPGADAHPRPTRETMPYDGALEGLRGAEVPRASIRREFGGTAPDETLTFTDYPGPGLRKWNSPGGRNEDVGAPGGGESRISFGDTGGGSKQDLIRQIIQGQIDEAKSAPRTLREQASQVVSAIPAHNAKALELDPNAMRTFIAREIADGKIDPRVGKSEIARFQNLADRATNKRTMEFDRPKFNELVKRESDPADFTNTAVTTQAQQGGTQPVQTEQRKAAALADATTTPPGAPGTTPSPALAPTPPPTPAPPGRSLAGFGERALEGIRSVLPAPPPKTGTPEQPREVSPEAYHQAQREQLAMLARIGAPMAVMAAGPEAWIPYLIASFGGGAMGEGIGEKIEGGNLDPTRMAEAGAVNTVLGTGAKLVGPAIEGIQGLRMHPRMPGWAHPAGIRALGDPAMLGEVGAAEGSQLLKEGTQQAASQGTQSAVSASRATNLPPERFGIGPKLEAGTIQDTLLEPGQSALDRTRQFSAEEGISQASRKPSSFNPDNLPAPVMSAEDRMMEELLGQANATIKGAPRNASRIAQPYTETAGLPPGQGGSEMERLLGINDSALGQASQYSAEEASAAIPKKNIPVKPGQLPALRGNSPQDVMLRAPRGEGFAGVEPIAAEPVAPAGPTSTSQIPPEELDALMAEMDQAWEQAQAVRGARMPNPDSPAARKALLDKVVDDYHVAHGSTDASLEAELAQADAARVASEPLAPAAPRPGGRPEYETRKQRAGRHLREGKAESKRLREEAEQKWLAKQGAEKPPETPAPNAADEMLAGIEAEPKPGKRLTKSRSKPRKR